MEFGGALSHTTKRKYVSSGEPVQSYSRGKLPRVSDVKPKQASNVSIRSLFYTR
jgi:hypothetical protein